MHAVYNDDGKVVSGDVSHPDINSPEVQKEFHDEMNFWLKEWLPKQDELAAKTGGAKATGKSGAKAPAVKP